MSEALCNILSNTGFTGEEFLTSALPQAGGPLRLGYPRLLV